MTICRRLRGYLTAMDTIFIILIILLVVALAGLVAWVLLRERSRGLRERFGPEYERSIAQTDDRRAVESELRDREKRHRQLDIRPLTDDERAGFADRWTSVQQGFVDDPGRAMQDADGLVGDVMRARGYPLDDFDQQAADISVQHPIVVQRYREARVIADAHVAGRAGTEDLRQAVTSYRALIVALLEPATADDRRRDDDRGMDRVRRRKHDHTVEGKRDPGMEPGPDAESGANGRPRPASDPDRREPTAEPHDQILDAPGTNTPKETRA